MVRADSAEVLCRAEPSVLGRPQILPRDFHIGILRVAADVDAHAAEGFAVDIDPRVPRRMPRLARDVGTVVDAVEVDALAVVVDPVGRRGLEARHGGGPWPPGHVRHYFGKHFAPRNPAP